ncbi:hypothetical protein S40288_05311, partial [Stachybotrys chartarum IBT 40288]
KHGWLNISNGNLRRFGEPTDVADAATANENLTEEGARDPPWDDIHHLLHLYHLHLRTTVVLAVSLGFTASPPKLPLIPRAMSVRTISKTATVGGKNIDIGVASKFDQLVVALKKALGPSSGLTSDDVDVNFLTELMREYDSVDDGWRAYAFGDASRGYTRNLVDDGNGKSNLLVLVWSPGKGSPIHDHGNAHCLMKILKGSLTETRFAFPEGSNERPMEMISEKTMTENSVAYMADELGLHRVMNKGSDFAVSLHLYTPPNVAKKGCFIFDQKTGKRSHVPGCAYFSTYGRLLKE